MGTPVSRQGAAAPLALPRVGQSGPRLLLRIDERAPGPNRRAGAVALLLLRPVRTGVGGTRRRCSFLQAAWGAQGTTTALGAA